MNSKNGNTLSIAVAGLSGQGVIMFTKVLMAAFKDDPAKWQRYVEGEIATVHMGKKVTPGYDSKIHFSKRVLPVLKGDAICLWDAWQNPCCIIAQYTPKGQLVIHDVCLGEQIGTKELIEEQIDILFRDSHEIFAK